MLLVGKSGARFELKVLGYQFPSLVDDEWDSNWLNIRVDVKTERGTWNATDPSLLTSDVALLADWLEATAEGRALQRDIDFLEPNLSFEVAGESRDEMTLRVWFELELRPSWAPADEVPARDLNADLELSPEDLRRAAAELREQLREFPPRALAG